MENKTELTEANYEQIAESVYSKYAAHVELFESNSMKAKFGQSVTPRDIAALGAQFEAFNSYIDFTEANAGSLGSLGQIPVVGIDVITAVYAQSLAPVLASVQPMEDEQGLIWYKKILSGVDRAGVSDMDVVRDRKDASNNLYNSSWLSAATRYDAANPLASVVPGTQDYNLVVEAPVRPHTVRLEVAIAAAGTVPGQVVGKIMDDGQGGLLGNNASGTIDYATGAIVLNFNADPAEAYDLIGCVQCDMENKDCLPCITAEHDQCLIKGEVQAAKIQYGSLQAMMMQKRWGSKAGDEFAQDLVNELTVQQNVRIVEEYVKNPMGVATFETNPTAGVSKTEHRLGFGCAIAEAEENIIANAGMGGVSNMIAGRTAMTFLRSLPNFKVIRAGQTGNVAVAGELDGIPVVRASGLIPDASIVAGYKGTQRVDAPVVVAPVLPLFMTEVTGDLCNPLKNSKAAASLVGYKNVCPQYTTTINLTTTP